MQSVRDGVTRAGDADNSRSLFSERFGQKIGRKVTSSVNHGPGGGVKYFFTL